MQFQDAWATSIDTSNNKNVLKTKSDLLDQIERRLNSLKGDKAERLGISNNRLTDLILGKIDTFGLIELESIARRAGVYK